MADAVIGHWSLVLSTCLRRGFGRQACLAAPADRKSKGGEKFAIFKFNGYI